MSNPFFAEPPPPPADDPVEPDPLLGLRIGVDGPPVPPETTKGPAQPILGRRQVRADPMLWVVGLHGGCGASSVAQVLGDHVEESPLAWPDPVHPGLHPQVLLVARSHALGLDRAENAIQTWAAGDLPDIRLLGVMIVDDAPRVAKPLLPALNRVLQSTPRGWHLQWQEAWRSELDARPLTRSGARTFKDIHRRALREGVLDVPREFTPDLPQWPEPASNQVRSSRQPKQSRRRLSKSRSRKRGTGSAPGASPETPSTDRPPGRLDPVESGRPIPLQQN